MKPILKTKHHSPLSIKLAMVSVPFIIAVSFVLCLNFSGKNKNQYVELINDLAILAPQCSTHGGFNANQVIITLTSLEKNKKIYYTLDGSEPSLNSAIYKYPIIIQDRTPDPNNLSTIPTSPRWKPPLNNVFKGTVLRAIIVTENAKKSNELVRTFFVDPKGVHRYSFPIIALTINSEDWFGYKNGIYVLGKSYEDKDNYIKKNISFDIPWWEYPSNYLKRGTNAERPAYIEFYEPNGKSGFESNAGIRINGNATRGFSQKSLRIIFSKKYSTDLLNYRLFPNYEVSRFKSIILRNSGNDWNKTMFRDAFMQSIMANSKVDIQQYRPAITFVNGEYWGIYNIRERFDENYISNKYKMNTDSISILELDDNLFFGKKVDTSTFHRLLSYLTNNDLSLTKNYEFVKKQIDVESFMDFIIANVFFCNSDWPNNNVKFWRYRTSKSTIDSAGYRDGRWRWMLYDTDWGFGYTSNNAYKQNLLKKAKETGSIGIIFTELLKNKEFLNAFVQRFNHYLSTTFSTTKLIAKINEFEHSLSPEMNEHIARWRAIGSYKNWELYVQELKDFAKQRPGVQLQQLDEFEKENSR